MAIKNKEVYNGKTIKQVKGIVGVFDAFFKNEKFDNIVEIGTGNGGFSIYFAIKSNEMRAEFTTYDIKKINPKTQKELKFLNARVVTCDINKSDIEDVIKDEGRCLILNDGGLKVPEFHKFAKFMKKDDIMMTHDYYKGRKEVLAGTIVLSEVINSISKYSLQIINESLFDSYLWLCVTKK